MKKTVLTMAAIGAVFAGFSAVASAADNTNPLSGVSIRLGAFMPTQSDTQTNGGSTWFAGGVDYKLPGLSLPLIPKGSYYLSLDYTGKGNYRSVPLLLNWSTGGQTYLTLGAGVSFARFPEDNGNENDRVRFAYAGGIGYNFNTEIPMFLEARFFGNDQPRVAGVGVFLGWRF